MLAALWVAAFVWTMPHTRSIAARLVRYERAVKFGFVEQKNSTKVVPGVATAVKVMAKSLQVHAQHDALAGTSPHFGRQATHAAKPWISSKAHNDAETLPRQANAAKHRSLGPRWADTDESNLGTTTAAGGDFSSCASSSEASVQTLPCPEL